MRKVRELKVAGASYRGSCGLRGVATAHARDRAVSAGQVAERGRKHTPPGHPLPTPSLRQRGGGCSTFPPLRVS